MSCETLKRSLEFPSPSPCKNSFENVLLNPWMDPKALLAWVQKKEHVDEQEPPKKRTKKTSAKSATHQFVVPPSNFDKSSYQYDILKMLHAFGDVALPLLETAEVMERIAKHYLTSFLDRIVPIVNAFPQSKRAKKCDKKKLTNEIVLKAIEDPEKNLRAQDIISFLNRNKKMENADTEDLDDEDLLAAMDEPSFHEETKSKITTERLHYRDGLTKNMTTDDYFFFTECSKISFTKPKKRKKFLKWANMESYNLKCDNDTVDLIGYLVYEHLEEIVRKIRAENPLREGPIVPSLLESFVNKM